MKGRTSLYLDLDLIDQLIKDGWNVSALMSEALDIVCSPDWEDMRVMMRINLMEKRREEIKNDLSALRNRTAALELEDTRLSESIVSTKSDWEIAKRTTRLSGYIKSLNQIIIATLYHIPEIEETAKDILPRIKELNPDFDLLTHIDRLRTVMEY